ncbi:MAG: archaellin/type IV pilin N-terminal domain-containing protein [Candidatus Pacearchaeota archaeon]
MISKKRKLNMEKKNVKKERKAISPVITTMLLIMVVIIIAIIIILWFNVFIKEYAKKTINGQEKRAEDFCRDVSLKPFVNEDESFGVTNEGNVPVYSIKLKVSKTDGTADVLSIPGNLNPGFSAIFDPYKRSDFESVKILPVLLGKRKSGAVEPVQCPEINGIDI